MPQNNNRVVLQWVGDISLNEELCNPQYHEPIREGMAKLADELVPCDLRVGNFEAPIWGDGSVNRLKTPRLCTTKQAAECILPLRLDVVFLGNNHIYDCREKGFENTTVFLRENNIKFLGARNNQEEASQPLIIEKNGISLGFLNYVHRNTNANIPADAQVFLNYFDEKRALKEIADLSLKINVVLVYLHWGAEELIRLPSLAQRRFGRHAVETGAKVIVFDHAHCLQPHENWRDGHILYGLGNFIFGNGPSQKWPDLACRTAMATIEVSRGRVEKVRLDYLCQKNGLPDRDNRKSRSRTQKRLNFCIRFPDRIYSVLYKLEKFFQFEIVAGFQFMKISGGFIPSLLRIRKRHFARVGRLLILPFKRSRSKR